MTNHETPTVPASRFVLGGFVFMFLFAGVPVRQASAAVPPVPTISGPITGPGLMYPNPPVSIVPAAVKVEDFPYVTEEYFVSGASNEIPYTTRIIVRRPRNVSTFSGTVVAEALHAGGRSLIFEWSRVSILTRGHMFVEIVHSPANIALLKTFNAERYASLSIAMGQTNDVIAQVGRLIKEQDRTVCAVRRPARDAHGHIRLERHGAHVSRRSPEPADARTAVPSSMGSC